MKRVSTVSWLSSRNEAKYWYDELGQLTRECWEVIESIYKDEELIDLLKKVDKMIRERELGAIGLIMVGAVMMRMGIFEVYSDVDERMKGFKVGIGIETEYRKGVKKSYGGKGD